MSIDRLVDKENVYTYNEILFSPLKKSYHTLKHRWNFEDIMVK